MVPQNPKKLGGALCYAFSHTLTKKLAQKEPLEWPVLIGAGIMFGGNLLNIHAEEKRLSRLDNV